MEAIDAYVVLPVAVMFCTGLGVGLVHLSNRLRRMPPLTGARLVSLPELAEALGAQVVGTERELVRGGTPMRIKTTHHGKSGPQWAWVGAQLPQADNRPISPALRPVEKLPKAILRRETDWDKRGKRLGLNLEPQTGVQEFDEAIYVETSDGPTMQAILAAPDVARTIYALVTRTDASVVFDHEGYAVALRFHGAARPFDPALLAWAMDGLAHLIELLPPMRDSTVRSSSRDKVWTGLATGFGVTALLIAPTGMLAFFSAFSPIGSAMHAVVFPAALVVTAVLIGVAWGSSRRKPLGLTRFALFAACAIALGPGIAAVGVCAVNALPDRSATEIRTKVVQKRMSGGKSPTYRLEVESWENAKKTVNLKVSRQEYDSAMQGRDVVLTVGDGALGYSWVRDVKTH